MTETLTWLLLLALPSYVVWENTKQQMKPGQKLTASTIWQSNKPARLNGTFSKGRRNMADDCTTPEHEHRQSMQASPHFRELDRCIRCMQWAIARVEITNTIAEIELCMHHFNKHARHIRDQGWLVIIDQRRVDALHAQRNQGEEHS